MTEINGIQHVLVIEKSQYANLMRCECEKILPASSPYSTEHVS